MKASSCGTWVEQQRAKMGWKPAATRKASGADPQKTCSTCKHFERVTYTTGSGGVGIKRRCVHLMAAGNSGHATTDNAGCDQWERKSS